MRSSAQCAAGSQLGGRLVLSVGAQGTELLSPALRSSNLPRAISRRRFRCERFGALENFAGACSGCEDTTGRRPSLPVAKLRTFAGESRRSKGIGPTNCRWSCGSADGFGELVFVAVDLNQPPLDRWPGLPQLLAALLGRNLTVGATRRGRIRRRLAFGIQRSVGPACASSLDQFPDVRVTPFWLIGVLAGGVHSVVVSRRLLADSAGARARAVWPWVSFAVIVVGVSIGAWWLGRQFAGRRVQVDQAEVVDFDVANRSDARQHVVQPVQSGESGPYAFRSRPLWHGPHAERPTCN